MPPADSETQPAVPPVTPTILSTYLAMKATLSAQVVAMVAAAWAELTSWRDTNIDTFAAATVPLVAAGQAQMASLTSGYLAETLGGRAVGVPARDFTGAAVRNGADPIDVYHRPGIEVWTALSQGTELDQAVAQGARRAQVLALTDLQLASTHTARQVLTSTPHVVGYRRVLAGAHSCDLCTVASTQRYHTGELMPIHNRCSCAVEPIVAGRDPGQIIDSTQRPDIEVVVHHHGELGPVLAVAGQHFTGPDAIPA